MLNVFLVQPPTADQRHPATLLRRIITVRGARRRRMPRMTFASPTPPRVIALPKKGIAYNECLYAAVERQGLTVIEGFWAGRWLLANVRTGDIVHVHWPSFFYYDERSRAKTLRGLARFFILYGVVRSRGARVVWTAHNLYPHDGGKSEWTHRLVRRFITRSADLIIAHSPSAKRILIAEFGVSGDKIAEVPHGNWIGRHVHSVSTEEARGLLGVPRDAFVYCIVGACRPYKNLEALIEAFGRIEGDTYLLIAGQFQSPEYRARIDALLAKLSPSRFRLDARFVADDEVQNYIVASDAFVVPYKEILTSGSAMLGLSFGVPVIAPKIGGIADMVADGCGVLYDAGESDGLFAAMIRIREARYSREHIISFARQFDWSRSAQAFRAAIARLEEQRQ